MPGPHDFAVRSSLTSPDRLRPKSDYGASRGFARLWRRSSARRLIAHGKPALQLRSRRRCRVHRNLPLVVTTADAPLSGTGWRELYGRFGARTKRNIFAGGDWTG